MSDSFAELARQIADFHVQKYAGGRWEAEVLGILQSTFMEKR